MFTYFRPLFMVLVLTLCGVTTAHAFRGPVPRYQPPIQVLPIPLGTTPAQIHASFGVTLEKNLRARMAAGGPNEVYKFLWSLSSFQFYQLEGFYWSSTGRSLFVTLPQIMGTAYSRAAINRLMTVNLLFAPMASVPGGQRPVQKIATIAGFPANTSLFEIYAEYASLEGYTAAEAIGAAAYDFSGPFGIAIGGGYAIGTGISWLIQTFDPELQMAIGEFTADQVELASAIISTELQITIDLINTIDTLGAPGLNDIDFDGYQMGDESLGALKTGQGGL